MKRSVLILNSFFDKKERRYLFGLLLLMLSLASMELMGVGSIFFYIKIITDQDIILSNKYLSFLFHTFGFSEIRNFLLFLGGGVFLIMLIRGILGCVNLYFQASFSTQMRNKLSQKISERYLTMPYIDFLSMNTAVLSKHLLIEVSNVVSSISTILSLCTDSVIAAALIILMLIVDPLLVLLVVGVLGGLTYGTVKYTRKRISYLGAENEHCNRVMFKAVSQALGGLKEIKVFNKEIFFQQKFEQPLFIISMLSLRYTILNRFPTMIINLMGFGTLLCILLYLLYIRGNLIDALPVIGLLAISIQRLLPSMNNIYTSIALIRKYESGVIIVREALDTLKNIDQDKFSSDMSIGSLGFEKEIRLENVTFTYPGSKQRALDNICLEIPRNVSLGIIGSSGAGKSTLVDVLLGLLPVSKGRIFCDDILLGENNLPAFHKLVGYVPQQTYLLDDTLRANIAFGVPDAQIKNAQLTKVVRIAQLEGLVAQLPQGFDANIGERGVKLSGGQRQRIGIARALYHDPEILILDEATNSLDLATESEFLDSLRVLMGQKTLITIAHRLSSLALCERIVMMEQGEIVAIGSLNELATSCAEFRKIYEDSIGNNK